MIVLSTSRKRKNAVLKYRKFLNMREKSFLGFFAQVGQGICGVFILGIIQNSAEHSTGQQVLADPIFSRRIRLEEVSCFPISAAVYSNRVALDTITCKILRTGGIFGGLTKRSIQFDYPKKIPSTAELKL